MPAFVLEIGTEELPARFLPTTERELFERFSAALAEAGLPFSGLSVCSTPRRHVVHISQVAEASAVREEVVTGPSVKAAYDMGGRPTRAAEGFARTHGVALEDTFTLQTEKGEYIAVRKNAGGDNALDILTRICPAIISALPFPKKMRWGSGDTTFARPMRWIVALLGATVVPFSLGLLQSGNLTYGHRVHGPGPFQVPDAVEYFSVVQEQGSVVSKSADRRSIIREQVKQLASEKGGSNLWKQSLKDELEGLC